jgi:hypothetical protein
MFVFFASFVGALGGMWLRQIVPTEHIGPDSKETVKVAVGLVATMTALVLGLVTAAAKSSFDGVNSTVRRAAAELLTLDRTLAQYGPETRDIREASSRSLPTRCAMPTSGWVGEDELAAAGDLGAAERRISQFVTLAPRNPLVATSAPGVA